MEGKNRGDGGMTISLCQGWAMGRKEDEKEEGSAEGGKMEGRLFRASVGEGLGPALYEVGVRDRV